MTSTSTKDLTIQGTNAGTTIIDGDGRSDRVFDIFAPATVTISNVTIRNAFPLGGMRGGGGGICNCASTATLTDVAISGNTTGGGICNCAGTMTLTNVTVSGNTASGPEGFSGGILNTGNMALTNVTVSGNMAQSAGGIANLVVIVSETADLSGGPVVRQFSAGTLTMTNATVTGNTPSGIFGSECSSSDGCGKSSTRLKNTIVANNFPGGNCSGDPETITSLGHDLDSGSSCGFAGPGDLSNTEPMLGPLQNNGGPTLTHALLLGSPAIDKGDNAGCPSTDQRGVTRPKGAACDIGAYEFEPSGGTPPPARIPTLSEWGLLGLAGLLASLMAASLRHRAAPKV